MEDLLIPQICMDVEETPLDVGKDDASDDSSLESNEPEIADDDKVKLLLENLFSDNAQVPLELTEFEKEAKRNVFAIGEPAVQFQRLHCTACNVHLGSAPIGHLNRYIHPLLKVLLCKACYEFYCSGEFDKDEDGSEMYCRWCGQGGKVMCCAQCAYVFCQKCVRQNLGKRTLELIKDSDDWLCFGCNPTQLINLKIICTSLFEFVQEEIRLSKSLNNIERLKVDHSVCCQKVKASKRKRDEDTPYVPHKIDWEEHKHKKNSILKNSLSKSFITEDSPTNKSWNQKEEAEVVCTPDLLALMEDDPPPLTAVPKVTEQSNRSVLPSTPNTELNRALLNTKQQVTIPSKLMRPEGKKIYTIAPKSMMIYNTNLQRTPGNLIRLQTPTIKFVPSINKFPAVVNSIPAQIAPGTKHEWYDKAAAVVSTITSNLSATLTNLTKEQKGAKSVEQLANIHNKLQELLSSSVNSLIQARKNLRAEFLDDLNKLKFSNVFSYRNNIASTTKADVKKVTKNDIIDHDEDDNDDDVIIVNSESSSAKPFAEPPPLVKISSSEAKLNARPYLKVRSVSQLLSVSSECITIPDDPPGPSSEEDIIVTQEKDPLEVLPEVSHNYSPNDINKNSDDSILKDIPGIYDDREIRLENTLTENKIEELVIEDMKLKIIGVSEDELKRALSARILLPANLQEKSLGDPLETVEPLIDANGSPTSCENEIRSEECINIEFDVSNGLSVKKPEENSSVADCENSEISEKAESPNKNEETDKEISSKKDEDDQCVSLTNIDDTPLQENLSNNRIASNENVSLDGTDCLGVSNEVNDANKCDNDKVAVTDPLLHLRQKSPDYFNSVTLPIDQTTSDCSGEAENSK